MEELNLRERTGHHGSDATLRDILMPLFRHRGLMALCFFGILLGSIAAALMTSNKYEAHFKVLVKRERVDPVVSAEAAPQSLQPASPVTEEEINSEVQLILSEDLLQKVVLSSGLQNHQRNWVSVLLPRKTNEQTRLAEAVNSLAKQLRVAAVNKTDMIDVSYQSSDPQSAYRVLNELANFYLEKHLAVHRPPGAFEFFQRETDQYRDRLEAANMRLGNFIQGEKIANAAGERDLVLQDMSKFDATLHETETGVTETQRRIDDLEAQLKVTPARIPTAQKVSDNGSTLQVLEGTLATLELKHIDMMAHYDPNYRPLKDLENQIAQARAQVEAVKGAPLNEDTTDVNPAYLWLKEELVKAQADLATLQGRAVATRRNVGLYRQMTVNLGQKGLEQEDLIRDVKTEENNFLLYLNKREEARISDALDSKRILNVAIAESPTVPALPTHSPLLFVALGILLAPVVSTGAAFVADYADPSFRTPDEVAGYLDMPVLASLPKPTEG